MALIGKIRKNFWFVLILLGFALAAFVIMDMTSASNMGGAASMTIANVEGSKVDYREFQTMESAYYGGSTGDVFTKRQRIWDFLIDRSLVKAEAEELGLAVSQEELMDLQFGPQPNEIIQQNWRDPQTGQLDLATLNQIKSTIENDEEMNPSFRQYWAEQEKHIIHDQLSTKLNTIVSKGIYTPTWMAENSHKEDNDKVDFKYVQIPFDNISGDEINLTDADYKAYLEQNSNEYRNDDETRIIGLAVFDVAPTAEDSVSIQDSVAILKERFANTENDSLFAANNNGNLAPLYFGKADLPESAAELIDDLSVGQVSEPFIEGGAYSMLKLIDKRIIPDSVEARHILRRADRNNAGELEAATAYIDSLENRYRRGIESFDSLAIKNSEDPGSGALGGDLGTFQQGRMVPEFNEVCFVTGRKGRNYTVVTQFGVHLIRIENQIFNTRDPKYKLATINFPIIPSEATQNVLYDKVSDLVGENRSNETLAEAIESEGVEIVLCDPVGINDFSLTGLEAGQETRDIIRWAFDEPTESGDVSPEVYTITDNVNYYNSKYIIATLDKILPAGLPPVSAVKDDITDIILNNKKAEKFISTLSFSSLEELASNNEVAIDSATDVSFKGLFVTGIGNEPEVISAAFNLENMAVSKPIIGKSGIYVVQPISKVEASSEPNISLIKQNLSRTTTSKMFSLIDALQKNAEIEDNRYTFF